jgi:hypothetical protein
MKRLIDVLIANGATGLDGWMLTEAQAISADGQWVVGSGRPPESFAIEPFVAFLGPGSGAAPDPLLDLAALPDVDNSGAADFAVLVEVATTAGSANLATQAARATVAAIDPGIHVFVKDGATGNAIATKKVFGTQWRAVDLAVTQNAANSFFAVLAQKDDGRISVALYRARNGALVRRIAFFNANWSPAALVYVPNAEGNGDTASPRWRKTSMTIASPSSCAAARMAA